MEWNIQLVELNMTLTIMNVEHSSAPRSTEISSHQPPPRFVPLSRLAFCWRLLRTIVFHSTAIATVACSNPSGLDNDGQHLHARLSTLRCSAWSCIDVFIFGRGMTYIYSSEYSMDDAGEPVGRPVLNIGGTGASIETG